MGVDIICAHAGIDQQMVAGPPWTWCGSSAERCRSRGGAGGLDAGTAAEAVRQGQGSSSSADPSLRSGDVAASARKIREAIDRQGPAEGREDP